MKQLNREKPSTLLTEEEFMKENSMRTMFSDSLMLKQVENHKNLIIKQNQYKKYKIKEGRKNFYCFLCSYSDDNSIYFNSGEYSYTV